MGLTIDMPVAGLLSPAGAQGFIITGNTTAVENGIYIIQGSSTLTLTLPTTPSQGSTILVKNTGTGTVTVSSAANIEGTSGNVTMNTQHEFIRFVYISASYGYLKA